MNILLHEYCASGWQLEDRLSATMNQNQNSNELHREVASSWKARKTKSSLFNTIFSSFASYRYFLSFSQKLVKRITKIFAWKL